MVRRSTRFGRTDSWAIIHKPVLIIVFLITAAVAAALMTGLMRHYALRSELLGVPNPRSSHTMPTPPGGGVAIVLTVLAGLVLLWGLGALASPLFVGLGVGGGLVAGVGYLDDCGHVAARLPWAVLWRGSRFGPG